MGVPKPLSKDQADSQLYGIYDDMNKAIGKMPNFFGVLARIPEALNRFVPFYNAVMSEGKIPAKSKELAYLKTSIINQCQY